MWTVSIVLGAITGFLALLYWHRRKQHNILHELGIPGPEPHWLFGNLKEFAPKPFHKVLQGWTKQYGKIYGNKDFDHVCKPELLHGLERASVSGSFYYGVSVIFRITQQRVVAEGCESSQGDVWVWVTRNHLLGRLETISTQEQQRLLWFETFASTTWTLPRYYEGPSPIIVTTDLDLLKQVFVKQFASFHSRKPFPFQADPETDPDVHMILARGARWKRLRSIINPTFSSAKMKGMYPIFNERITALIEALEDASKDGKPFNIYGFFQRLTLDVIGRCAFGMDVNSLQDSTDPFLSRCRAVFDAVGERKYLSLFALLFPELRRTFFKFIGLQRHVTEDPGHWLTENIDKVVRMRRKQEYNRTDLLQLMMESEDASAMETPSSWIMTSEPVANGPEVNGVHSDKSDAKSSRAATSGPDLRNVKRKLTNDEIKMQGVLFLLAGYETTSTTLGYTCYELALNPHVQTKLQEEIDENIGKGEPSYEKVHGLPYLDMVLNETLRLYPLASLIVARHCTEPCDINGLHIPAGVTVQADVWSIHRDPEIWGADPDKFDPERFTPEKKAARHPMSWLPFGAGPRNCVGLRFGVMEAKTALIRVLQKFTVERCDQTEVPLTLVERGTVTPKNGVTVKLTRRQ